MEILTGIWTNIEAVTFGGVSVLILTNALTQAVKKYLPIGHEFVPYVVGIILCLIAGGFAWQGVLAGLVVGYLAGKFYDAIRGNE